MSLIFTLQNNTDGKAVISINVIISVNVTITTVVLLFFIVPSPKSEYISCYSLHYFLTELIILFYILVNNATVSTCPETPLLMSCVNGNLSFIFDVNGNISFTPNLVGIKILLISPAVVELLCHIAETFA